MPGQLLAMPPHAFRLHVVTVCHLQALEKKGILAMFPIQKSVFDPAMAGTDLVARARTGSGKTLAFSLPIIEALLKQNQEDGAGRGRRSPRALILAPTRELAKQVAAELESATSSRDLDVLTVYGGTQIGPQMRQIERGVDVLVGTPGRVLDLVDKRQCAFLTALLSKKSPVKFPAIFLCAPAPCPRIHLTAFELDELITLLPGPKPTLRRSFLYEWLIRAACARMADTH